MGGGKVRLDGRSVLGVVLFEMAVLEEGNERVLLKMHALIGA